MSNNVRILDASEDVEALRRRHRTAYLIACSETGNRPPCICALNRWWPSLLGD